MTDIVVPRIPQLLHHMNNDPAAHFENAMGRLAALPESDTVPESIVVSLHNAVQRGYRQGLNPMINLFLTRRTAFSNERVFTILKEYASCHPEAAYACGIAYLGQGPFAQPSSTEQSWRYFYAAYKLGKDLGFTTLIDAVCDGVLKLSGARLLEICEKLFQETKKLDLALFIGTVLSGFPVTDRSELKTMIPKDPDQAYIYLCLAYDKGNEQQVQEAMFLLASGFRQNLYQSEAARTFQPIFERYLKDCQLQAQSGGPKH